MQQTADTPCGRIRIGSKIRIDSVDTKTSMFPGGVDTQALELIDQTGTVTHIGGGGASGTWGGLSILLDVDRFTVLEY